MTKFSDVIETLDNAADGFDAIANKEQKKLFDDVVTLIKELELDASGNVKQSISNLKRLNQIKAHLSALSKDKEWAAGIGKFLEYFNIIQKQQNEFFSHNFTEYTLGEDAQKKNELMKQIAVQNTIDALMGDGLKANVTDKINDILLRAVTSGAKYADLQAELRAHLMGQNGGQGAFARYATTYATTALSQFTGQHNKLVTDDLGLEWFVYEGSNKETTREFCEQLTKKRFIHISEIPTILTGKIDDYQCAIYPKTGLPLGMIAGTTPENFQCNCGGWNCRHQLVPVADAVVPQALRDKFKKIKPTAPQNEPKQGDTPLDLTPYQEQIGKIEKYIEAHPKSAKIKGYLAQAMQADNATDLEAILKAAISDMNKFDASKKATEKKKAIIEQAKVDQESKAKAAAMESAKSYVEKSLLGKYQGKAYEELWKKIEDALGDGNAAGVFDAAAEMEALGQKIEHELPELVNPKKWAEEFTFEELKQANDYVKGHMMNWKKKGKEGKELVKAITEEMEKWLNKNHPTYAVTYEALQAKAEDLIISIDKAEFEAKQQTIIQYTKEHNSAKIQGLLDQINALEAAGNHDEALAVQDEAIKLIKKFNASKKATDKKKGKTDETVEVGDTVVDAKECEKRVKKLTDILSKYESRFSSAVALDDIKDALRKGNMYRAMTYINQALRFIPVKALSEAGIPSKIDMDFIGGEIKMITAKNIMLTELSAQEVAELHKGYKTETVEHADRRLRGLSEKQWASLTAEEKLIITKYTQTYSYLNEPLRNLHYSGERTREEYERDLRTLTNALAKCRTEADMVVRRGVDNFRIRELGKWLSDVSVGDKFTDGGFLSTAIHRDKGFTDELNLIIFVPKGSMGFYAEPCSHYNDSCCANDFGLYSSSGISIWNGKDKKTIGHEEEWIGQRGSRFQVTKVSGKNIYLKLIGQLYDQP